MITASGYSKDPGIMAEGIALTLPVQFFEGRGCSVPEFTPMFERYMRKEDALWNFRLTNLPTREIQWVYLIWDKKIQFRTNFVMYERNIPKTFRDAPDGKVRSFPASNWIILTGPAIAPPREWPKRGFQGFQYTTFLF